VLWELDPLPSLGEKGEEVPVFVGLRYTVCSRWYSAVPCLLIRLPFNGVLSLHC
jgi:hypothetical protein